MIDLVITERTEPFTINEVFEFIDDTCIGKMDAHELKSRIADAVQAERNKAIDGFAEKIREICSNHSVGADSKNNNEPLYAHRDGTWHSLIDDVVEQLKAGGSDG